MSTTTKYEVRHTHTGALVSTHRLGHVARAAADREDGRLAKAFPRGINIGVEIVKVPA